MTANYFPAQVDPFKLAEQGFQWSGQLPLSRFQRLASDALGDKDQQVIQFECKLSMDAFHRFVWLDATIHHAEVALDCQRCLNPVQLDLATDVHLAILNDENMVDRLEDEVDFVVLGENDSSHKGDYLNHAQVDILALIEDELLLLIPFSPKHDDCEHQYQPTEIEVVEEKRENPFEILASLKKS
ncbi:MAG: YceD family protein [Acinetobacter sp.]|nr:YceD family protein [Acinetobacter sp.]